MHIPDLYLGTSSWRYDDWKGGFYPLRCSDELAYYSTRLNTVEIDSTWYHTPSTKVVTSWRERVTDDFRFAAKAPRLITHNNCLHDCGGELGEFLHAMSHLGEKRGPILFQFPPQFTAQQGEDVLRRFLPLLPTSEWQFAMEFRNNTWFHDRYADLLRQYEVAWTLADFGQFVPQLYVTAPWTYIRWMGDRDEPLEPFSSLKKDRDMEEDYWIQTITGLPVDQIWGYFNNHWRGFSPGSALAFAERMGLPRRELPLPTASDQQQTLF